MKTKMTNTQEGWKFRVGKMNTQEITDRKTNTKMMNTGAYDGNSSTGKMNIWRHQRKSEFGMMNLSKYRNDVPENKQKKDELDNRTERTEKPKYIKNRKTYSKILRTIGKH